MKNRINNNKLPINEDKRQYNMRGQPKSLFIDDNLRKVKTIGDEDCNVKDSNEEIRASGATTSNKKGMLSAASILGQK